MDIIKYIKQHTENLQNGFIATSPQQRQRLKIVALGFYFLLPNFEKSLSKYTNINIDKGQLISDINNERVEIYQKAMLKLMSIQTTMKNLNK